jgi:hypothetical protein
MVMAKSADCTTEFVAVAELLLVIVSATPGGGVTVTDEKMLLATVFGETKPEMVKVTTPLDGRLMPDQTPVSGL